MKSLLRKQYVGVVIAAIILSMVIAGFSMLFLQMKKRQESVHEVKQTLATYEQNKKVFTKETATVNFLTSRTVSLESKKITEDSTPALLSSIELLGKEKGVTIAITSVQTPTIDGEKKLFLDIVSNGSFDAVTAFAQALSTQTYQVRFSKFALHQQEEIDGVIPEWNLLATVQIISF